jgi:outer membrane protein assembly factor BamB
MKKLYGIVLACAFLMVMGGCSEGVIKPVAPDIVAEFRGNAHNSGTFTTQGLPKLNGEKWKLELDATIHSSPILADQTLYMGSEEGQLYAIDATDGKVIWQAPAEGKIRSSAAVYGDELFILDSTSKLYGFDRLTGKEKWRVQLSDTYAKEGLFDQWDYYISSPTIVDDIIYIGSEGDYFYALNRKDGSEVWKAKMTSAVHGKAVVTDDRVYVADRLGTIFAFDRKSGKEKWEVFMDGIIQSSLAFKDDVLYYGSRDTLVHAIDAKTGSELWNHPSPNFSWVGSSAAVSDQYVAIGASDSYMVHIFDRKSGEHFNDFVLTSRVFASPVIVDGIMYFGSAYTENPDLKMDAFYAVDIKTNELLWKFDGNQKPILATPVIDNGIAYVAFMDGTVYALN